MKNICAIMVGILFATALPAADPWNINENFVGFAIADADWTIDKVFPGTKLIFDGQYSIRRGPGKPPQHWHRLKDHRRNYRCVARRADRYQ